MVERKSRAEIFIIIALLFCSIFIALIFGEIVLRIIKPSAISSAYYVWPPNIHHILKPREDIFPGINGESEVITNSIGLRGDELLPSHTYRILAIGGSTTRCLYLDQKEAWPQLLQELLNGAVKQHKVWVGNAGVSATTTRHHLTAMRYLPLKSLKIDAVIMLVGGNDFTVRLAQDKFYKPYFSGQKEVEKKLLSETFAGSAIAHSFYERSAIWQSLKKIKYFFSPNVEDEVGKIYTTWQQHRQNASEIRNSLPDLSSALEEYSRNINAIIDVAGKQAIRLILMSQPTIWRDDLPDDMKSLVWFGGIGRYQEEPGKPYYSIEALAKGMKEYNNTLLKICNDRHIECLDAASMVPKDTTAFFDDMHFNEGGSRKAAEILSGYLSQTGPLR